MKNQTEKQRWAKIAGLKESKTSKKSKSKQQLDENVVGVGAINPIFAVREPKDYELAFEHYLGEMYDSEKKGVEDGELKKESMFRQGMRGDTGSSNDIDEGIKTIERLQDAFPDNSEFTNHLELAKGYLIDQNQI
tara:strand:+ start:174 stop:578 length:405 start_codon:yes stop_codon:yes gene_type:complete